MDGKKQHEELVEALCDVVANLDWLENHIEHGAEGDAFYEKINTYIDSLNAVVALKDSLKVQIPVEALTQMDEDGKSNPELFSRTVLQKCKQEYEHLDTRLAGLSKLKSEIGDWNADEGSKNSK